MTGGGSVSTDAQIIPFPRRAPEPRSCFDCIHFAHVESHCHMWGEQIDSELFAAADCDAFETASNTNQQEEQ